MSNPVHEMPAAASDSGTNPASTTAQAPGRVSRWRLLRNNSQSWMLGLPYLWLLLFFLVPFLIVVKISFSRSVIAVPPYEPMWLWLEQGGLKLNLFFSSYGRLFSDSLYWVSYLNSIKVAGISTLIALSIAYPIAYGLSRVPRDWRNTLLILVVLPFWTSFLIRVYAWIGILKNEGLLNALLLHLGWIDTPLVILNTDVAVYIGIVYSYLPFMILPLYSSLEKLDLSLLEAAADLGCRPLRAFWQVTVPMSLPGILAGCFLVFIPAMGEFVIPDLLGGSEIKMIGKTLWNEFFINRDWPTSAAVAVVLLLLLLLPILWFQRFQDARVRA